MQQDRIKAFVSFQDQESEKIKRYLKGNTGVNLARPGRSSRAISSFPEFRRQQWQTSSVASRKLGSWIAGSHWRDQAGIWSVWIEQLSCGLVVCLHVSLNARQRRANTIRSRSLHSADKQRKLRALYTNLNCHYGHWTPCTTATPCVHACTIHIGNKRNPEPLKIENVSS
jgi:hypothetical protein